MQNPAKITLGLVTTLIILVSCNNKDESSPYEEILQHQPFSALTDSIKKESSNDDLYFRRAVLLNKNNFPEPAIADFRKAWSLKKEERYALGISLILLDKSPDSAIVFLNSTLKELPKSTLLQLTLARAYDAQDGTIEAMSICNHILDSEPTRVDVLKMKADLLDKNNDPDSAVIILEKAYKLAPFDVDLNYSLAFKYAENKNPKIIALCDSLMAKDSLKVRPEPYYYEGIYYSNINDKLKAISFFDNALQRDYYYLNAYIEKGRAQYDLKKFNDALRTFELVNTISPKFPDGWFWMGKAQEALGDKANARINYLKAFGLDNTFTEAKDAADRL